MKDENVAEVAILIVGFHNPVDMARCIAALSSAVPFPNFDVFICENGGRESYEQLIGHLTDASAPWRLQEEPSGTDVGASGPFLATRRLRFLCRPSNVMVGCATDNLGYAGGINAWLRELIHVGGWKGVWILNPDTEPAPDALAALVHRAELGGKGMVGSTILESGSPDVVRCRGGLHWQKFVARNTVIGFNEKIGDSFDLSAVEDAMDSPSGASMYVTRACVEKIGLMDESFFLFDEDLEWGLRAKKLGVRLGYASGSIVPHQGGTTTGAASGVQMSRLAFYLQHRNAIHFVRRHFPWSLPVRIAYSILIALRLLAQKAPGSFVAVLEGVAAGLRGETGQPSWHRKSP